MEPNNRWQIITGMDVCVDLIVTGDTIPRFGQVEQVLDSYAIEMGGSCAIFAAQCAKLEKRTLGIGIRGADIFGDMFENALANQGVDISHLVVDPSLMTGLGIALLQGDDRAILTYNGTIDALTAEAFPDSLLQDCDHLHIGSYYLMKRLAKDMPAIAHRAKALGLTISLDTNWDPTEQWASLSKLLPYVDILLPNEQELAALGGLDKLLSYVPIIVVKRGAQGASVYRHETGEAYHMEAFPVPLCDAIGAGDSFDAGFVCAWIEGLPLSTCLAVGCACGSLSVRAQGGIAGQGYRDEVAKLVAQRGIAFGEHNGK
jgi:ribokinase